MLHFVWMLSCISNWWLVFPRAPSVSTISADGSQLAWALMKNDVPEEAERGDFRHLPRRARCSDLVT
jgi:hypothetical protein